MALGRVSPFSKMDRPASNGANRENVTNSALESPFASLGGDDFSAGGGQGAAQSSPNSGITGSNPSLASMGLSVGTMGVPGLGGVTGPLGGALAGPLGALFGGLIGNVAQGKAQSMAMGAVPDSLVDSNNNPVSFIGNQGFLGTTGLGGVVGNILGSLGVPGFTSPTFYGDFNTPNQSFDINNIAAIPNSSPNTGSQAGFSVSSTGANSLGMGHGSTFSGPSPAPGIFGSLGPGPVGIGSGVARGAGTGNASQGTTNFGARASGGDDPDGNNSDTGPNSSDSNTSEGGLGSEGVGSSSGPGVASGSGEAGVGTAGVGSGGPGAGPGEGDAGATGGAGTGEGSDGSGNYHEGGFVELEKGQGNQNDNNAPGDNPTPEVQTSLEQGEFVVNKEVAGRFGPLLNRLNELSRNKQLQDVLSNILEGAAKTGFGALGR